MLTELWLRYGGAIAIESCFSARGSDFLDTHFYVDNAPPSEVIEVLRVLRSGEPMTPAEIAELLENQYGFQMQRDRSYSPRRLMDLTLAQQVRKAGKPAYTLSERGARLQGTLNSDHRLAMDLLHYLHFTGYRSAEDRKVFWSYRRCCESIWSVGRLQPPSELAPQIQSQIYEVFPALDASARKGARFNSTAVSAVYTWLRGLDPSPIDKVGALLQPRVLHHFELALLALDDTYRARGYQYGDPVLLDRELLKQVAGVFFANLDVCSTLLTTAARITQVVRVTDTLSGPAIRLEQPYSVDSLSL